MKIFLDTAEIAEIASAYETGLVDGVTTNPTLIRRSGRNPVEVIKEISSTFPSIFPWDWWTIKNVLGVALR